jgi:hypothetical protein
MGSCCGGRKTADKEVEVTFRDGSKRRVASLAEARLVRATDDTTGNHVQTWRWVPKIAKSA